MRQAVVNKCVIASPGTDRAELLEPMVKGGLMKKVPCKMAMGVMQFENTAAGEQFLIDMENDDA